MARLRPFNPRSGCQSPLDVAPAYISKSEYARAIAGFFWTVYSQRVGTALVHRNWSVQLAHDSGGKSSKEERAGLSMGVPGEMRSDSHGTDAPSALEEK